MWFLTLQLRFPPLLSVRRSAGVPAACTGSRRSGVGLGDVDSAAADAAPGVCRSRTGRGAGDGVANDGLPLLHVWCRPLPTRHPGQGAGAGALIVRARPPARKKSHVDPGLLSGKAMADVHLAPLEGTLVRSEGRRVPMAVRAGRCPRTPPPGRSGAAQRGPAAHFHAIRPPSLTLPRDIRHMERQRLHLPYSPTVHTRF